MNETDRGILTRFHIRLISDVRAEIFAQLYSKKAIDKKFLSDILHKSAPNSEKMTDLLLKVPDNCLMSDFLECLDLSGFGFLCKEIKQTIENPDNDFQIRNYARQSSSQNASFVDIFAEKVKVKIHNSEARMFKCDFERWARWLLANQHNGRLSLSESRQQADCCFILLDSLAIIERTHSSDKKNLWRSPVFREMDYLISKTSNPNLSRIRHYARYGVALFLGGRGQEGEEYIETALRDAKTFLPSGRDIGNCIFALVNYKLHEFGKRYTVESKQEILNLIEEGISCFKDDDDEMRNTWRVVYLDKKISCHMSLEPSGRAIADANISSEDRRKAKECLHEMDKRLKDKRRQIHFYREQARLYKQESKILIAKGFLEQAMELCIEGGYESELRVIEQELGVPFTILNNNVNVTCMITDIIPEDGSHRPEEEEDPCSALRADPSPDVSPLVNTCISDLSQKLQIENNMLTDSKE